MLAKFKRYQVGTVVHGLLVLVPFLGTIVRKGSTLLAAEFILLPYKDIEQDFIIVKREPEEWDDSLSRYSTKDLSNFLYTLSNNTGQIVESLAYGPLIFG